MQHRSHAQFYLEHTLQHPSCVQTTKSVYLLLKSLLTGGCADSCAIQTWSLTIVAIKTNLCVHACSGAVLELPITVAKANFEMALVVHGLATLLRQAS